MNSQTENKFFSGTSGLVFEEPNKNNFPPYFRNKTRLYYYSSLFSSLEVNSSFYRIPQYKTCVNWSDSTPETFVFTMKIWKGISHVEKFNQDDLKRFINAVAGIGSRKGCLLIQYPAKLTIKLSLVHQLLNSIKLLDPEWKIAVEIRNKAWLTDKFYDILEKNQAALVQHDRFNVEMLNINFQSYFVYLRFHGPTGNYRGNYSFQFLEAQAQKIKSHLKQGYDVYVYFNNTIGEAAQNLKTLNRLVLDMTDL